MYKKNRCVDCLHYETCKDWAIDCFGGETAFPYVTKNANEIPCDYFKLAADVVEVIRCEKCKFSEMVVDIIGDPHLYCKECNFREVGFDAYCSRGKRREV